ncbi:MAG: GTPase ObgE [Chloroflexota bacterium]|nr:GTPase ObgE [Chloroflexota bacterium]
MFFDEAKIYVKGGDGGNGCVAFRREKYVPFGGPSGGDGGAGGDVYLVASPHRNTLLHFKRKVHFKAGRGQHGRGKNQTGRRGEDVIIEVPLGVAVRDADTRAVLADLTEPGQRVCVAGGGRGGRGNAAFATSTNQAPRLAEKGETGEERWLYLELKLIAGAGIVGMPNAGKSTLLSVVSAARPKIADYPFTTLEPNLGVVAVDESATFVLADLPGLIEGASQGAGLGHEFLRHVERTHLLIHLLNGGASDPLADYEAINEELALFSSDLAGKPQIVVLNKMDLPQAQALWPALQAEMKSRHLEAMSISAATGEGVNELMRRVADLLAELPQPASPVEVEVITLPPDEDVFSITSEGSGVWRVHGIRIERAAQMTNWDYSEAIERFHRILVGLGIAEALQEAGVSEGDTVYVGDIELEWSL